MAKKKKPNILVIWGDDIGITNLSCYSDGLMGYRTPNIDRIANEGMRFTDSYGEQSCTAGRSPFITGQSVYRTGLSKVGMPGVDMGLSRRRPDDRRDAQAAGLCHRSVRQEPPRRPEQVPAHRTTASTSSSATCITSTPRRSRRTPDYPTEEDTRLQASASARGVMHSWATEEASDEVDERFGRWAGRRSRTPAR